MAGFLGIFDGFWQRRIGAMAAAGVIATLVGCSGAMTSSATHQAQRQAVQTFYDQVIALDVHGLPTDEQLAVLEPLIAPALLAQLQQAREQQALDFARHQGSEPPLVQGALFFSLFEGARELIAIEPLDAPGLWAVSLGYGQGSDAFEWVDWARVGQVDSRWVIEDIEFMGQWDFARSGWLSNALLSIEAQAPPR